jgi:hypothetical protein
MSPANVFPKFARVADLVGTKPVSPQQAAANRRAGRRPVRPREGRAGLIPISAPTFWRWVQNGLVKPHKVGGTTMFDVGEVLAVITGSTAKPAARTRTKQSGG